MVQQYMLPLRTVVFFVVTIVVTVISYFLQFMYVVFSMTYTITTTSIVLWCYNYVFVKNSHDITNEKILKLLGQLVFISFLLTVWYVGSST